MNGSTPARRFPDWTTLDSKSQAAARAQARAIASRQNASINAFLAITPDGAGERGGPLASIPFAAKDMFRTPTRIPTGGMPAGRDLGIDGDSPLMARLEAAGADLVGFTNMTELASEPSG